MNLRYTGHVSEFEIHLVSKSNLEVNLKYIRFGSQFEIDKVRDGIDLGSIFEIYLVRKPV